MVYCEGFNGDMVTFKSPFSSPTRAWTLDLQCTRKQGIVWWFRFLLGWPSACRVYVLPTNSALAFGLTIIDFSFMHGYCCEDPCLCPSNYPPLSLLEYVLYFFYSSDDIVWCSCSRTLAYGKMMYSHRADTFKIWNEYLSPADILNRAFVCIQHTPEQKERLLHSPEAVAAIVSHCVSSFSVFELHFMVP